MVWEVCGVGGVWCGRCVVCEPHRCVSKLCLFPFQGLRTTYFSLIAPYSSFCKNGEVLASLLDTEEARDKLTQRVTDLQADWTKLGVLFSDILQRLSSVLMESQAFQKIADDLDKWMVKTSQWLEGQGLVAVQADLVTAQIESFKVNPPFPLPSHCWKVVLSMWK